MTTTLQPRAGLMTRLLTPARRVLLRTPRTLWTAFIALHVLFLLALLPTILGGEVLGDLPLYRIWADAGLTHNFWQGIDKEWVYPIGALAPITIAGLAGPALYQLCWFLMTATLNGLAVGVLTRWGRDVRGFSAAWVWLLLTFLLSPVGLLRLEGITAPLVVMALALIARRPVVAGALLAAATWIKVWPAAVLLAVLIASLRRISVLVTGIAVTAGVVSFTMIAGGAKFLTGFITMQSDRALQLEAPVTTPWVWLAALHKFNTQVYQNFAIETREVSGPGAGLVASLMTPVMFTAIAAIAVLILIALRRGAGAADLLLIGALALVSAFIVFNKVGSPQYMLWLVPIVVVGVTQSWQRWRVPAYLLVAISGLTTLVFPVYYLPLVDGDLFAVSLLTARNLLLGVLLLWAVAAVLRAARRPVRDPVAVFA
ncbi:MAG: DUF2029 domain-containing protein [Burkholderiaceae bacterium]|nr:DUF2029 domain-containing protein [Microbacteriaceae bacterium]